MKKTITLSLAALFSLMLVQPAFAGHNGRGLERVEDQQRYQIRRGVERGELTRHEAKKLRKQQRRIKALKREFMDDGWLSKKERRILKKRYRKAENRIERLRYNDERKYRKHRRHRDYGDRRYYDHDYDYDYGVWPSIGFWFQDDGWYVQKKWR